MKKIWLALAGMILAFSASAAQITDGKLLRILVIMKKRT